MRELTRAQGYDTTRFGELARRRDGSQRTPFTRKRF